MNRSIAIDSPEPSEDRTDHKSHRQGMAWIEVTNGCNLNCTHCYSDSFPGSHVRDRLFHEDYMRILHEVANVGMAGVQFIGGEPLLYKRLPELLVAAQELGFEFIEIFSNLTVARLDVWSVTDPTRTSVATSIYSYMPEVHDAVVRKSGSFSRTMRSVKDLIARSIPIRAGFIELEVNAGQFEKTKEYLNSVGVASVGFDRAREFGRKAGDEPARMSELCGSCAGRTVCITYEGEVLPCIMARDWPLGNVLESPLRSIMDAQSTGEIRQMIHAATADRRLNELFAQDLNQPSNCEPNICTPNCQPGCQPWCSPTCQPSCYPGQTCIPCNPYGSRPCPPNGRCQPTG